jgi:hypothetical protein
MFRSSIRWAWAGVIAVALALSNYSLAVVGHRYGLPYLTPLPLAWLLSIPFDLAAIIAGDLTLRYARELGSNGAAPRLTVISLAGISAWLNSEHASILHLGIAAHIMYCCPPVIAILLFELKTHFEYRSALREAGRTVDPLPSFGAASWFLHGAHAARAISQITRTRVDNRMTTELALMEARTEIGRLRAAAQLAAEQESAPVTPAVILDGITTKADAVRIAAAQAQSDNPADVLAWLMRYERHLPGPVRGFSLNYVTQCIERDRVRGAIPAAITTADNSEPERALTSGEHD